MVKSKQGRVACLIMVVLLSAANSKLERREGKTLKDGPDRTSVELLKDTYKFLGHGEVR
jgi:hypothetical protein